MQGTRLRQTHRARSRTAAMRHPFYLPRPGGSLRPCVALGRADALDGDVVAERSHPTRRDRPHPDSDDASLGYRRRGPHHRELRPTL